MFYNLTVLSPNDFSKVLFSEENIPSSGDTYKKLLSVLAENEIDVKITRANFDVISAPNSAGNSQKRIKELKQWIIITKSYKSYKSTNYHILPKTENSRLFRNAFGEMADRQIFT